MLPSERLEHAPQRGRVLTFRDSYKLRTLLMNAKILAPGLMALSAVVLLSSPAFAQAQPESKFYVNANVGGQLASRTYDTASTLTVYDETARLDASYPIGTGVLADFGAGYRVFGDVFVGVTVSMFSKTGTATTLADVPDPLLYDRPKNDIAGTATGLKHSELLIMPQVVFARSLTSKIGVALGAGPSIVRLKQDVITAFTVAPQTQNVTPVITSDSGSGTGVAVSLDLKYSLTKNVGVGGFARFAPAKVQLDAAGTKVNAAGMQAGGGIRLSF